MRAARAAIRWATHLALLCSLVLSPKLARPVEPTPGESVNMVSGTRWPGGDPFLQRQNEPSIAVSSHSPLRLVAGANDYRTVDLADPDAPDKMAGDAWLGLFKSFDGGQSWQSVLLPGYRQDRSPEGLASPLHGYEAAADPVIRAGTDGWFFYSGIAFDRSMNKGQVFVARLIDLNDKENGDATLGLDSIRYVDTKTVDLGTAGQFLDKPWIATDVPRPGARTCTLPGSPARQVPGGAAYLAYAMFTGANESSSKIMFTRSLDCGASWEGPQKLSESNSLNQGTAVAVDPLSGAVYVAWRRFATSSQGHAILVARSTDAGRTFGKAVVVAELAHPFDQPEPGVPAVAFRTISMPTIAVSVDPAGTSSWVHLAWAERPSAGADARIVMTTLPTAAPDGSAWPPAAPVAAAPLRDDAGNEFTRGHQLMPALAFGQGRLVLLHYDTRLDHTRGYFRPHVDPATGRFGPDAEGRYYLEERAPLGGLLWDPLSFLGTEFRFVDDAPLLARAAAGAEEVRHVIDVRVGSALPGPAPEFSTVPASRYLFGLRGDEPTPLAVAGFGGRSLEVVRPDGALELLQELQANPPNLPLFKSGTRPFIGDYIDVAGPAFERDPDGGWSHLTRPSGAPVHYAVWTSNQDVRPPPDGDWTTYTPVGGGGTSLFDPSRATRPCVTGREGMRNQNIYSSRITEGLLVSSPQTAKPLSPTETRTFVVIARNTTAFEKAVRLELAPSEGVRASFANDLEPLRLLQRLDVAIPPHSGIHRSIFARSGDPAAPIVVQVRELEVAGGCSLAAGDCAPRTGGASGAVTFNPPGSEPSLRDPDGAPGLAGGEIYAPSIGAPNVTNPNVTNLNVTNPNVTNPNVTNPNVTNPNVTNLNVTNPNVTNPNVTNPNVTNPNVTNPNVTNAAVSDATYQMTNEGNTTHSYHVKIVGDASRIVPPLQLILSKSYATPASAGCELVEVQHPVIVATIDDVTPAVLSPADPFADPNIPDPRSTNATISLAPGESALITLRGMMGEPAMASLAAELAPVVVPHAGGSYAASLFVASDGESLPPLRVGTPYEAALHAAGGTAPYAWAVASGALPRGLSLSRDGRLAGTPSAAGTSTFVAQVTDSAPSPATARRSFSLSVAKGSTSTSLSASPVHAVFGEPVTLLASVAYAGQADAPGGVVTFRDRDVLLGTAAPDASGAARLVVAPLAVGEHHLTATYSGDAGWTGSASEVAVVRVARASTAAALSVAPPAPSYGQPVALTARVTVTPPGAGVPSGTVTFLDGPDPIATVPLGAGGSATWTEPLLGGGLHSFSASYSGDERFLGSAAGPQDVEIAPAATTTLLVSALDPSTYGQLVTLAATVIPSGPGTPTGTVTFRDGALPLGEVPLSDGAARLALASLEAGVHSLTASYSGDGNHAASASATIGQVVLPAPTTTLLSTSPNPSTVGELVTLTASVGAATGVPGGSVAFFDGTVTLGSRSLSAGTATLATSSLGAGTHSIAARYLGDGNHSPSISPVVAQLVKPLPYRFTGFLSPLAIAGTFEAPSLSASQRYGSTVPVKWQLQDRAGTFLSSLETVRTLKAYPSPACSGPAPASAVPVVLYSPTTGAAGGSTFRWDPRNRQFIFNWDTSKGAAPGCFELVLELDDLSPPRATTVRLE